MRKRNYGDNSINTRIVSSGDESDDGNGSHKHASKGQQQLQQPNRRIMKQQQTLIAHRRSGYACFVIGVIAFCLLQAATFIVIDNMGSVADDDKTDDDRSMFGWPPNVFSTVRKFFWAKGPLHHVFSPGGHEQDQKPLLIIGGSDGSGTRAFVDTLRELGAVVVADDPDSFDIHAVELCRHQGWPGLINAVLNFTHTGDYEWEDLIRLSSPEHAEYVRNEAVSLFRSLRSKYDISKRYFRREYEERLKNEGAYEPVKSLFEYRFPTKTRHMMSRLRPLGVAMAGKKPTMFPAMAKGISFVVKAPVSMLVMPLLAKFYGKFYSSGHIKFLHVVRDGRDVALSSNQSPVLKFYRSMYTDSAEREEKFKDSIWNVRAMQLWNDWNTQVYDWATRHDYNTAPNSDVTVDYLWMRSEDLLPGSPRRLECLMALATFVGSSLTPEQLCELSQQEAQDYGKSVEHKVLEEIGPPSRDIRARWRDIEEDKKKRWKHDRGHKNKHGFFKRRLDEIQQVKIIPSDFVNDFEMWKDLVQYETSKAVAETKEFVLSNLIVHGDDLRKKWDLNQFNDDMKELKVAGIKQEEISVLIQQLRLKMQETKLFKHRQKEIDRPGDPSVKKRYGKWQGVLRNNTELATYFYQEGARGLELFGYHPSKEIRYTSGDEVSFSDCLRVHPN
ncbi:hypothetical protein IV203_008560 [Nitzschia inconspicua]|uniref:Sulfotransferase n=1 Tax=Nitzschia inconspicua TaxID=303405 RepID=A0A9K3PM57_9STRA|nr:hypothetical protein IV203_008560 [Nitzschia inconspicua]